MIDAKTGDFPGLGRLFLCHHVASHVLVVLYLVWKYLLRWVWAESGFGCLIGWIPF